MLTTEFYCSQHKKKNMNKFFNIGKSFTYLPTYLYHIIILLTIQLYYYIILSLNNLKTVKT